MRSGCMDKKRNALKTSDHRLWFWNKNIQDKKNSAEENGDGTPQREFFFLLRQKGCVF